MITDGYVMPFGTGRRLADLRYFKTPLQRQSSTTNRVGTDRYAATTAIAVISTMISGTAKAAAVSKRAGWELFAVDFLADIGELLRVTSV